MNFVLVVNDSPWGSTLAVTALRLARAVTDGGHKVDAVLFREEGVYHALRGTLSDADTPELSSCWCEMSDETGTELLVCQSSARRRLGPAVERPFREAGLVEFIDRVLACERVLTF